ncbi:hypothetical protein [Mycolicibacterium conceptionense]|uniref:hypothetical protein n=1 Tax=Mycolicibacterium conceptionense TaxID=451644 RepID=UPI00096C9107|nr:hypothetical protein [Mycolicibacterium conceptionense]OMB86282.1 hypothetical protein A5743_26520 [Mycolicibacterium conceptionense]
MGNFVKTAAAGAMLGGSLLFSVGLGIAHAAPETAGDGKVNLTLGNVSVLENVDDAAAAQIAAGVCENTDTASLTTAVQGVDANGTDHVVCTNNLGTISFSQNDTAERPGSAAQGTAPHSLAPTTAPSTVAPGGTHSSSDTDGS